MRKPRVPTEHLTFVDAPPEPQNEGVEEDPAVIELYEWVAQGERLAKNLKLSKGQRLLPESVAAAAKDMLPLRKKPLRAPSPYYGLVFACANETAMSQLILYSSTFSLKNAK